MEFQEIISPPVEIVEVFSYNVEYEFRRISCVARFFPFVTIDTEFPGVIYQQTDWKNSTSLERYQVLRANVDSLHLIQLGITLSDSGGNHPKFRGRSVIWQLNFREFDVSRDLYAAESIELLKKQGIDLEKNRREGVDSRRFSQLMLCSGLIYPGLNLCCWITFHGSYDFAYLLKAITGKPLPEDLNAFYGLLNFYFGLKIYDVKQMIKKSYDGVYGGLEKIAKTFRLKRSSGNAHSAGSDSLLTWDVFQKIILGRDKNKNIEGAGELFGLEVDPEHYARIYITL